MTKRKEILPVSLRRKLLVAATMKAVRAVCMDELENNPKGDPEWHADLRKAVESRKTMREAERLCAAFVRRWRSPEELFATTRPMLALVAQDCDSLRKARNSALYRQSLIEPFPAIPMCFGLKDLSCPVKAEYRRTKRAAEESAARGAAVR